VLRSANFLCGLALAHDQAQSEEFAPLDSWLELGVRRDPSQLLAPHGTEICRGAATTVCDSASDADRLITKPTTNCLELQVGDFGALQLHEEIQAQKKQRHSSHFRIGRKPGQFGHPRVERI
jgi:hypothetical protein